MNECMEPEVQEMLPDLLHRTLDTPSRARVEAHLAGCAVCTEDLRVLRTVADAAVFAPAIDVDRIVRQIPPYKGVAPVAHAPARSRIVSWLVAASLLLVVGGGGSLLVVQQKDLGPRVVAASTPPVTTAPSAEQQVAVAPSAAAPASTASTAKPTHALAIAAGVDGLSDGDLRQLMNDMDSFDALPSAEPEPVIPVDGADNLNQGF
jgi:Putative zinc-finger